MASLLSIGPLEISLETILAVSALGLTLYQAWLSRKHNRLSVKPRLAWETHRDWSDDGLTLRFRLKNNGVGPAIVKKLKLSVDGRTVSEKERDPVEQIALLLFADKAPYHVGSQSLPGIDSAIPAQAEIEVARIIFSGIGKGQGLALVEVLDRANLKVDYECLYGIRLTLDTSA